MLDMDETFRPDPPAVIDIRIVCTYDAVNDGARTAETLTRLLVAEEHQVRLVYGRQAFAELDAAKAERSAVVLIWSPDAPSSHYMLEWAHNIEPARLVEIARAPGWPRIERRAPVIDFATWRGERGARAWNTLNDRLRSVTRDMTPSRPPPRQAALALGLASIAAIGGAALVRMHEAVDSAPGQAMEPITAETIVTQEVALGGPLIPVAPASIEDLEPISRIPNPRFAPLEITGPPDLIEMTEYAPATIREPTLLERLRELNPLRSADTPNSADEA